MSDDPIVQAVAEALEAHQIEFIDWQVGWDCGCNEHGYLPGMPALTDALRHQAEVAVAVAQPLIIEDFLVYRHQPRVTIENPEQVKGFMAKAIREAKAEAWDEGFDAGVNADMGDWYHPPEEIANPYRTEQEGQ